LASLPIAMKATVSLEKPACLLDYPALAVFIISGSKLRHDHKWPTKKQQRTSAKAGAAETGGA
jgi:hypothetical protein